MTREEAIKEIEYLIIDGIALEDKLVALPIKSAEALQLALEALQERPKGRWNKGTEPLCWQEVDVVVCSVCGEIYIIDEDYYFGNVTDLWNFCPNCGADMRESEQK